MVWSSAARKSASATPTVAKMRALRDMSAGICSLLGHDVDRLIQVRQRGAQTCALVGGDPAEKSSHAQIITCPFLSGALQPYNDHFAGPHRRIVSIHTLPSQPQIQTHHERQEK